MTNKELIELLQTMPLDAEVFYAFGEGLKIPGYIMFDVLPEEIMYKDEVLAYGNSSPKPPVVVKNVILLCRG